MSMNPPRFPVHGGHPISSYSPPFQPPVGQGRQMATAAAPGSGISELSGFGSAPSPFPCRQVEHEKVSLLLLGTGLTSVLLLEPPQLSFGVVGGSCCLG